MFDSDKWVEIWHVLTKNKVRTLLTGLGVFTGVFILIVLLATSDGLQRGIMGEWGNVSNNSFVIWRGRTTMAYKGFNPGRTVRPVLDDAEELKKEIKEVNVAYPRCGGPWSGAKIASRNGMSEGFILRGDQPGILDIIPAYPVKGRFVNKSDVDDSKKVAVIGQRVYKVLFDDDEDPIGEYIKINGAFFQVIGLLDTHNSGPSADEDNQSIIIPITAYQKLYKTGNAVSALYVNAYDEYKSEEILKKAFTVLNKKHKIHP